MKILGFMIAATAFCGCISQKQNIEVNTVKPWEGRYGSVEEMQKATSGMKLEDGESVWILSNRSMYRIIKQKKTEK